MNNLLNVPIESITTLTSEPAIALVRAIFRSECGNAKLSPSVLTISSRTTTADGGIDAEINIPSEATIPSDSIFKSGLTGFQIKSGASFKPWTKSAIRSELVDNKAQLYPEVKRILSLRGRYSLVCTGYDLTPKQRLEAQNLIISIFSEMGFENYNDLVEVLGASQLAEFAERYPGTASLVSPDLIQEAWVIGEWQRDAHMANVFETSPEQTQMISQIKDRLQGDVKHIRVLGEPGLGKTRIILETVKDESIAPYVLYIRHGLQFGQTRLFRQLVRSEYKRPLILVIDELPESEMIDIWRHLKTRCGSLKIISLDHGRDNSSDEDINRFQAPRLPDATIKKILVNRIGESREIDRWIEICEGSPRVALAVADNLRANPGDILKPPATVPLWSRFLHGYGNRDEANARQVDCVAQHLALFSRFGFEAPVAHEAEYIASLINKIDPTIGLARFQEIIQDLRARRVLQGSRTLFFVPKALHIYLWKQFWECYGSGFKFNEIFNNMPVTLHAWFLNMFKYAEGRATAYIIENILKVDGIFSNETTLISNKGSQFLSNLAEANPSDVLRLLEATIGKWSDEKLSSFKDNRQTFIGILEKIAVWQSFTTRAIQLLVRLAVNENANNSNNATGTLIGLFCIGIEAAATESTPQTRLPAMLKLLRSDKDSERLLGLKAMSAALDTHGNGFRIIGPEYQGLKERAKLWVPKTYGEWWDAYFLYFQTLIDETKTWPTSLRPLVCEALLNAVEQQIKVPRCTEIAFQVLEILVNDNSTPSSKLAAFFYHWKEFEDDENCKEIGKRLRKVENTYTTRDLASRFQRYVLNVDWMEWDEDFRQRHNKRSNHAKSLVKAISKRISLHPDKFNQIKHLLLDDTNNPALWFFSEQLALSDTSCIFMQPLIEVALNNKHSPCLYSYLAIVRAKEHSLYLSTIYEFLNSKSAAWLGASIALRLGYDDELFVLCLDLLEKKLIEPILFTVLQYGNSMATIPIARAKRLLSILFEQGDQVSASLLIELLEGIPFDNTSPFDSEFVLQVVSRSIPSEGRWNTMQGYSWKEVCFKLISWDTSSMIPLLDTLLNAMGNIYCLSYDTNILAVANKLVQSNPIRAWETVKTQFEQILPKWRSDLLHWLKGGIGGFGEKEPYAIISAIPVKEILDWIEEDPTIRAPIIAHATPGTLSKEHGGDLTRELLIRYKMIDGVLSGIDGNFHSGGWSGPRSNYLKRKREKFRNWLAAGFEQEITQWLEEEIEYLDKSITREEIAEERSMFS